METAHNATKSPSNARKLVDLFDELYLVELESGMNVILSHSGGPRNYHWRTSEARNYILYMYFERYNEVIDDTVIDIAVRLYQGKRIEDVHKKQMEQDRRSRQILDEENGG